MAALADGTIDMIATDHAPHTPEEKTRNDIWTVDCGFPGVETQMPLMLTEVNNGRMSICDYVRWSAVQSGEDLGSLSAQGRDHGRRRRRHRHRRSVRASWTIDDAALQSRSKISPWNGRRVKGLPIHTLVRGRFVMKDRTLVDGTRGWGRSVHAIQHMPPPAPRNSRPDHGGDRRARATVAAWSIGHDCGCTIGAATGTPNFLSSLKA